MASRVPLSSLAQIVLPGNAPAPGATAFVYTHATTTQVTVFQAETGAPTYTQPLTANSYGQLPGWVVAEQTLDVVATYQGVNATAQEVNPVAGVDVGTGGASSGGIATLVAAPSGDTTGATDNAAFAAAVAAAATNGIVSFRPSASTYYVSNLNLATSGQRVIVPDGCTLTLVSATAGPAIKISGAGNVLQVDGIIDGNAAGQSSTQAIGVYIAPTATAPRITGTGTIQNTHGRAISSNDGVSTAGLPNGTIVEGVTVSNPISDGLWLQTASGVDASDVKVRGLTIDKSMQSASTATGYGMTVHGNASAGTGLLHNIEIDDITAKLPTSPTNTMFGVELWGGSGGGVYDSRVSRIHVYGGSGASFDHCNNSTFSTINTYGCGIEMASCTDCTLVDPNVDAQALIHSGIVMDGPGANPACLRCSIVGGNAGNFATTSGAQGPIYLNGADHWEIIGTVIRCGSASNAIYAQNAPNGNVTGGQWYGAGTALDGLVLDGATSSGLVVSGVTVDGFTRGVVTLYSGTTATIDNVHVGSLHVLNMAGKPVLSAIFSATAGNSVSVAAFPGFRGNTTGLTSAQIDALFPCTPYDGQTIVDATNSLTKARMGGSWITVGGGGGSSGTSTPNVQSGTTYTLAISDEGATVTTSSSSAVTITVPPNASVAFPVGTTINVCQFGTGQVALVGASGVTLLSDGGLTHTGAQYAMASLWQEAANNWVLSGDLA